MVFIAMGRTRGAVVQILFASVLFLELQEEERVRRTTFRVVNGMAMLTPSWISVRNAETMTCGQQSNNALA